jgi:hypothetical protein
MKAPQQRANAGPSLERVQDDRLSECRLKQRFGAISQFNQARGATASATAGENLEVSENKVQNGERTVLSP